MGANMWIRQIHRWLSIVFTLIPVGIFIAIWTGNKPVQWVYYLPLIPLALLFMTGVYLFMLPYAMRPRRS